MSYAETMKCAEGRQYDTSAFPSWEYGQRPPLEWRPTLLNSLRNSPNPSNSLAASAFHPPPITSSVSSPADNVGRPTSGIPQLSPMSASTTAVRSPSGCSPLLNLLRDPAFKGFESPTSLSYPEGGSTLLSSLRNSLLREGSVSPVLTWLSGDSPMLRNPSFSGSGCDSPLPPPTRSLRRTSRMTSPRAFLRGRCSREPSPEAAEAPPPLQDGAPPQLPLALDTGTLDTPPPLRFREPMRGGAEDLSDALPSPLTRRASSGVRPRRERQQSLGPPGSSVSADGHSPERRCPP